MKLNLPLRSNSVTTNPLINTIGMAILALTLSACGGSSATDEPVSNPDDIDVNGDGIFDAEDDINGDNIVNNEDVILFAANNQDPDPEPEPGTDPNALEGNILPDCTAVDCDSANSSWFDNAVIAQNRSPQSTYVLGIQRILYCLRIGSTSAEGVTIDSYADGVYGPTTASDVDSYQNSKMLVADGVVGENTWDELQRDISTLVASGDGLNQLFQVSSIQPGCENLAQFAQLIAEPMSWQLVAEPGGTTYIPFSVNFADLP